MLHGRRYSQTILSIRKYILEETIVQFFRHNITKIQIENKIVKEDLTKLLAQLLIKVVKQKAGKFLSFIRAIENTVVRMKHHIRSKESKNTQKIMITVTYLLNYAASYPNNNKIYCKSHILYTVDNNAGRSNFSDDQYYFNCIIKNCQYG